jgi:predicted TIM-barrel fold metal-dependent hydrolase
MRQNRFPVIDGDGHITERSKEILEYLGGNDRGTSKDESWADTCSPFPSLGGWSRLSGGRSPGLRVYPDCESGVSCLEECGVRARVVDPTAALAFGLIQDPAWAVDIARAYNSWLHANYTKKNSRILGAAIIPIHDVPAAIQELRRVKNDLGMPGAMFPSVNRLRKGYGHESFFPLYEEACKLDLPIAIHGATSRDLGFDFFDSFAEVHALEHPLPLMIQMTNMIFQGVFELFPQLRVAYLEAGAGWVPFMMDRLDEDFERRGKKWAPRLNKRPSDYITGGQVYVSLESEERTLPYVLELFGEDHIFFASDYPHERQRAQYLHDIPELEARKDISDTAKRKILADNARRFYRLTD